MIEVIEEKPRYEGGSVLNLLTSIVAACDGARLPYALLDEPQLAARAARRHVVLLVVDGLGHDLLCGTRGLTTMGSHLVRRLTSVFPPTTAAAVTTLLTGLAPQQHGLTGWFTYFRELDRVVTVLPFKTRDTAEPLGPLGVDARELFGHTPVFDLIPRSSYSVIPRDIAGSAFNIAHTGTAQTRPYRSLEGMFAAVERELEAATEGIYVYAYWSVLDHLAHRYGIASREVATHARDLDRAFAAFLERIAGRDALVLLTADHGFADIAPGGAIDLNGHPALRAMLRAPLCGEPRTAYCYVKPGYEQSFRDYATKVLGRFVECAASEDLVAAGYFGPGDPHPELASRVGDFALLARPGVALFDRLPGERHALPLGVHGGGSAAEMGVPLVVAAP